MKAETLAPPDHTSLEVGVGRRWITTDYIRDKEDLAPLITCPGKGLGETLGIISVACDADHTNRITGTPGTLAWLSLKWLTAAPFYP